MAALRRGFGMIELVVAMAILSVVMLALIALFSTLLGSSTKTLNQTAGTYFAQKTLDELIRTNAYWPPPADASEGLYTVSDELETEFWHRVRTEPIPAAAGAYSGGYWIEVEVWWWGKSPDASRAGQGRLSTRLGRFHYPGGQPIP